MRLSKPQARVLEYLDRYDGSYIEDQGGRYADPYSSGIYIRNGGPYGITVKRNTLESLYARGLLDKQGSYLEGQTYRLNDRGREQSRAHAVR